MAGNVPNRSTNPEKSKLPDTDQSNQAFDNLVYRRPSGGPIVTPEQLAEYQGKVLAISIDTNKPEWGEKGAASSRPELAASMFPLGNGADYYAYAIRPSELG